jgi:hypothetical protein
VGKVSRGVGRVGRHGMGAILGGRCVSLSGSCYGLDSRQCGGYGADGWGRGGESAVATALGPGCSSAGACF